MFRRTFTLLSVAAAVLFATPALPADAANPHFIGSPSITFVNNTLRATGSIAGLGNEDVTAIFAASFATQCRNKGGNIAPGQNSTASQTFTGLRPENGRLNFDLAFSPTVTKESAGCPNGFQSAEIVGPISATLTFIQGGQTVLSTSRTF